MKKLLIAVAIVLAICFAVSGISAIGRITWARRGVGSVSPGKMTKGARLNPMVVTLVAPLYSVPGKQFGNALDSIYFWTAPRDGYVESFYLMFADSTLDADTLAAQCDSFFIVKNSAGTCTNIGTRRAALKANARYPRIPWFVTGTDTNRYRYVAKGDSLILRYVGVSAPDSILAPITILFSFAPGDQE